MQLKSRHTHQLTFALKATVWVGLAFVFACKPSPKKATIKGITGTPGDTVFVSNDLTKNLFKRRVYQLDTGQIKKLFGKPAELAIVEKNDSLGKYTVYNFHNATDTLNLFRNPTEGFYIDYASINDTTFRLRKDVKIGMPKSDLLKLVKANYVKYDTIFVLDEVSFVKSTFIFKNQKLKQIKMAQELD